MGGPGDREELLLGRLRHAGQDQHAAIDLPVVGVPVALLVLGQAAKELVRDDVLDPDEVGLLGVAVEDGALDEVPVHHLAVVGDPHLVLPLRGQIGLALVVVEGIEVEPELLGRRVLL
ncbi:hypothetical protein D3C87_1755120 [compost metagenome]